jgi:enamine deaminase RidA (YjgF/YER057c/UK114 family)
VAKSEHYEFRKNQFFKSARTRWTLSARPTRGKSLVSFRRWPARTRQEGDSQASRLDENGNILSYDIETQCRSVFQNVRYILEDAGSGWDKIVDVTVFLTNMKDDFKTYNKIYAEYFKDNLPCRTTVEINCLPTPIGIELKVIATID